MLDLMWSTVLYVFNTLVHNAIPLSLGIIIAAALNVYIKPEKLRVLLLKRKKVSILGSVAFGAFTPFCSCGTMAVVVSMLATVLPWGPIMAFITSSPLMSPDLFVMLSGIVSIKFAIALTISSVVIGLSAGYTSHYLEKYTNFFDNQIRFAAKEEKGAPCCAAKQAPEIKKLYRASISKPVKVKKSCCAEKEKNSHSVDTLADKYKLRQLLSVIFNLGIKQILLYFSAFAAIGYFINRFVPAPVIMSLFGANSIFSVPLAALAGIPLYVSDAGAIPLIKTLMDSGASGGAVLAFMITGPGTSIGAIAGSLTIMRKKAVFFYVSFLLLDAIMLGYFYNFLLFMGL